MKSVKFALRYGSGGPLPSLYAAVADQRRAIELTNALLARNVVIETNVIGGRLVLTHRDVVPALWALRTRFRSELTPDAARWIDLTASLNDPSWDLAGATAINDQGQIAGYARTHGAPDSCSHRNVER